MITADAARVLQAARARAPKSCERCGKIFDALVNRPSKFCCAACRNAAWQAEHRRRKPLDPEK